jgi:hypothetical protein
MHKLFIIIVIHHFGVLKFIFVVIIIPNYKFFGLNYDAKLGITHVNTLK